MPEFLHAKNPELRYRPFPIAKLIPAVDETLYE